MNVIMPGCFGLFLGAVAGGVLGVGAGFAYTTLAHTSSFEGYSGMLIFFTFMPIGAIVGAAVGAMAMAVVSTRKPQE